MKSISWFISLGLMLAMCACISSGKHDRPIIAVSIPPQQALLSEIVGDRIDVVTLMRADANPEQFEPSIPVFRSVAQADAYIKMGNMAFEEALLDKLGNSLPPIYDSSQGITLLYGTHDHDHGHRHDHHHDDDGDHDHGEPDPHVWSSPENLKIIAANMLNAVVDIDPANSDYYRANYLRLSARIDSVGDLIGRRLAAVKARSFLIWHPSLSYFAHDYDLHQIAIGKENKEMSVLGLKHAMDAANRAGTHVLFLQRTYDSNIASSVAGDLNIPTVIINPMSADWEAELMLITDAITNNQP